MREIKFRAWSNAEQRFVEDFILDRLGNEYQTNKCEFWGDDRDVVIMQFTGLKDKKGNEIYEGDMVTIYEGKPLEVKHGPFSSYDYDDGGNSGFGFYYDGGKDHQYPVSWFIYDVNVVGNIYQNPELLGGK